MNANFRWKRRQLALMGAAAAVVGGFGCATLTVSDRAGRTYSVKEGEVLLNDTIVALGKPDAALAQQICNANAVAFFGKAHTYLLVEGGQALLEFSKRLDSDKLSLVPDSKTLFMKDQTVWGSVQFIYQGDAASPLSDGEKSQLKALGFTPMEGNAMRRHVSIKGAVYPAMKLQGAGPTPLHHQRALVLRAPPTTESKPNLSKYAVLPVALAVDVVTAPVQLLGLGVLLLSMPKHLH